MRKSGRGEEGQGRIGEVERGKGNRGVEGENRGGEQRGQEIGKVEKREGREVIYSATSMEVIWIMEETVCCWYEVVCSISAQTYIPIHAL